MKRRFSFIAVLAVFLISSCTIIQPGKVGIKVNRLGDSLPC